MLLNCEHLFLPNYFEGLRTRDDPQSEFGSPGIIEDKISISSIFALRKILCLERNSFERLDSYISVFLSY